FSSATAPSPPHTNSLSLHDALPIYYGGDMIIKFNLNYDADPEIAKWFNTADFRRALALGIDRDQINETFWLGTGTPSSVVPADKDRKSTRLNSSHGSISYAVFCLKT